jgi:hypothetical protein
VAFLAGLLRATFSATPSGALSLDDFFLAAAFLVARFFARGSRFVSGAGGNESAECAGAMVVSSVMIQGLKWQGSRELGH